MMSKQYFMLQVFNVTLTEAASAAEDRGAEGEGVQPYSPLRGNLTVMIVFCCLCIVK